MRRGKKQGNCLVTGVRVARTYPGGPQLGGRQAQGLEPEGQTGRTGAERERASGRWPARHNQVLAGKHRLM